MKDADHPVWRLLTLLVCIVAVCVIIGLHASTFDGDEIEQFVWAILAIAGAGGVYELMRSKMGNK